MPLPKGSGTPPRKAGPPSRTPAAPASPAPGPRPVRGAAPAAPGPRTARGPAAPPPPASHATSEHRLSGWASMTQRKEEIESNTSAPEFYLKNDEVAIIQYLDEEPRAFEGHRIKLPSGKYKTLPCQLEHQRYCHLCNAGEKSSWFGAMRVLDYRGKWDKDASDFLWDSQVEKIHVFGLTYAQQLHSYSVKRRVGLTKLVIEISKTGTGKTSTFNLSIGVDESGTPLAPVRHTPTFEIDDILPPTTDEAVARLGY